MWRQGLQEANVNADGLKTKQKVSIVSLGEYAELSPVLEYIYIYIYIYSLVLLTCSPAHLINVTYIIYTTYWLFFLLCFGS